MNILIELIKLIKIIFNKEKNKIKWVYVTLKIIKNPY